MQKEVGSYVFTIGHARFSPYLEEVCAKGIAHVPHMLDDSFRRGLLRELEGMSFEKAEEEINGVGQRFERIGMRYHADVTSYLETLRVSTQRLIRGREAFSGLFPWEANDVVLQRYDKDSYLEAHRDLERHEGVVAIYTATGSCAFEILDKKHDGNVLATFQPGPGDLILLRGKNFTGQQDDERRFHRVSGSVGGGTRISVTFRNNTRPTEPIHGFVYHNS